MTSVRRFRNLGLDVLLASLAVLVISVSLIIAQTPSEFSNSVTVDGFSVSYPDGWSSVLTALINVTPVPQADIVAEVMMRKPPRSPFAGGWWVALASGFAPMYF